MAMPRWAWSAPMVAVALLAAGLLLPVEPWLAAMLFAGLIGAVVAAVHHAEVVAHRVGEPFGTLVLALAVTVIEVSLIVSLMLAGGASTSELARNTLFAVIMIICNGVMGLCLLVGGIRHGEQAFQVQGANGAFAVLMVLSGLTLVLPVFTTSTPGPTFSVPQLQFAGLASLALYAVFVFVQTIKHRDYFLPQGAEAEEHADPPTGQRAWASFALLFTCLVAVVGLAKQLAPTIKQVVAATPAPEVVTGIAIAMLVLLPETWAALRAAHANRLQTSLNLALGSALASIGLTIPAVVAVSIVLQQPLVLGLSFKEMVMLLLTFIVGTTTLGNGRTNLLQGAVHLVLFAAFLFLSLFP